jgi:SAM-dependent methyltransferase
VDEGQARTRYGFEQDKPERLAGIEAAWDPGTQELLDSLGVGPGWRCLEAGAGGGSIAAWLADRVGPDGSVLAIDIDTTHLERLASLAEIRRHDLRSEDLPAGSFDLVHERSVISWLGESGALERLAASLAPGGWLVLEDFDWAICGPADGAPVVAKGYEAILSLIEGVGYDRHYGRTLLDRLERMGLEEIRSEGRCHVLRGGSPGTAFERLSILAHRDALVSSGRLTEPELEEGVRYLADPAKHVVTPVLFSACGRRPL